jgi:hypothetical protein
MKAQTINQPAISQNTVKPKVGIGIHQMRQILAIEKAEDYYFHTLSKFCPDPALRQPSTQLILNLK